MAHIVEFKIAGLAGRKDVYTAKLNRDINVFFGLNGSGKTSLLKILHSALGDDMEIIKTVPFEWAEITFHSVDYNKNFVLTLHKNHMKRRRSPMIKETAKAVEPRISDTDESIRDMYTYYGLPSKELSWKYKPKLPPHSPRAWNHEYLPTYRLYSAAEPYSYRVSRDIRETKEFAYDWEMLFERNFHRLWLSYSNRYLSEIQMIQGEGLAKVLRRVLTPDERRKEAEQLDTETVYHRVATFLARQGSRDALGRFETFNEMYRSNSRLRTVINDINTTEQRIEKAVASRRKLEQLIRDMFTGNKTVKFKDDEVVVETDDGHEIGLNSLSSGEKHTLLIFIATLLTEIGSLLIDEPEISLHVDWQTALISIMRQLNPKAQLIIATHSPEITSQISDDKIFRL